MYHVARGPFLQDEAGQGGAGRGRALQMAISNIQFC